MSHAYRELILGGQKSGKSARAEHQAAQWLAQPQRQAVLIATAQPWDAEMAARIERHQSDRAQRVPGLKTVESPLDWPAELQRLSRHDTLVVVDCLTLWLTNLIMPIDPSAAVGVDGLARRISEAAEALARASGPVLLVSNEIGLGVIPMGREVRAFVDALGQLNQRLAQVCDRVTLMAAGLPLTLKAPA